MEVTSIDRSCKYAHLVSMKFVLAVSFWKNFSCFICRMFLKISILSPFCHELTTIFCVCRVAAALALGKMSLVQVI